MLDRDENRILRQRTRQPYEEAIQEVMRLLTWWSLPDQSTRPVSLSTT